SPRSTSPETLGRGRRSSACACALRRERVDLRVADEIEAVFIGDGRRVLSGPETPHPVSLCGGPPLPSPLLPRGKKRAPGHPPGAGDASGSLHLPLPGAGRWVERIEAAAVRADEHPLLPDRWGAVHIAARSVRPAQLPGRRSERVDLAVRRPDVDPPVRDRRAR